MVSRDIDLSELNDYFATISGVQVENIDYAYFNSVLLTYQSTFNFKELTCTTIKKAIMKLTSNTKGPDGFDFKSYKILAPYLLQSITDLFNLSLSKGFFPSDWKLSYEYRASFAKRRYS